MSPRIPRRVFAALLLLGGALPATAQLSGNSPFMPPQAAAAPGPTQNAPLEYAGYFSTPEGRMFRVKDAQTKAGVFLKINERDEGLKVTVKQFDESANTLTVEQDGRTLTLEERKSKIVSAGNAASMPPPMPMPTMTNVAPAVTQSVVVNPTPADEQKRLEAVAAEVARRRALREQAQAQMPQNPQMAVPQTMPPPQALPQNGPGAGQFRPVKPAQQP